MRRTAEEVESLLMNALRKSSGSARDLSRATKTHGGRIYSLLNKLIDSGDVGIRVERNLRGTWVKIFYLIDKELVVS